MNDDRMIQLLESIDRRLALMTKNEEQDLRRVLGERFLRSHKRALMFESIDGRRGSGEIAAAADVSERAAQMFVRELLDAGLVRAAREGGRRGLVVEHDQSGLLQWYLRVSGVE